MTIRTPSPPHFPCSQPILQRRCYCVSLRLVPIAPTVRCGCLLYRLCPGWHSPQWAHVRTGLRGRVSPSRGMETLLHVHWLRSDDDAQHAVQSRTARWVASNRVAKSFFGAAHPLFPLVLLFMFGCPCLISVVLVFPKCLLSSGPQTSLCANRGRLPLCPYTEIALVIA